jgi:hypothetical protein
MMRSFISLKGAMKYDCSKVIITLTSFIEWPMEEKENRLFMLCMKVIGRSVVIKILLIMPPSFIEPYLGKRHEMPLSWTVIFGLIVMGLLMLRMNPW